MEIYTDLKEHDDGAIDVDVDMISRFPGGTGRETGLCIRFRQYKSLESMFDLEILDSSSKDLLKFVRFQLRKCTWILIVILARCMYNISPPYFSYGQYPLRNFHLRYIINGFRRPDRYPL